MFRHDIAELLRELHELADKCCRIVPAGYTSAPMTTHEVRALDPLLERMRLIIDDIRK